MKSSFFYATVFLVSCAVFMDTAATPYDENTPPAVTITLETDGDGKITPFTGSYYMPTFDAGEWRAWVRHGAPDNPEDYCAVHILEDVTAIPADEWVFLHWELEAGSHADIRDFSDVKVGPGLTLTTPTLSIPLTRDVTLRAVFDHRPWFTNMDLVRSLESFLLATNQINSADELLEFDRGDGGYEQGVYSYHGNGIPDVAEMLLVEELLQNPEHVFSQGVWAPNVLEEFMRQREFAMRFLGVEDEDMLSAAAAYLTIGGLDYCFWLSDEALGVERNFKGYANTAGRNLGADKSADGTKFSNLEQWKWVLETSDYPPMRLELARKFVETVLDPDVPPADWSADPDRQNRPHRGTWNDPHVPKGDITIGDDIEAHVIDPGGGADLPISGTTAVHLGRQIRVKYVGEPGWFDHWSAPGCQLHGGAQEETVFVHVNPGQHVDVVYIEGITVPIPN